MENGVLLPTVYLGNLEYYQLLLSADPVVIDGYEHFEKQTWRNRCRILSPNGPMDLVIPVQRKKRTRQRMRDIRIANDGNWQKQHWRSLEASYRSSPYFEFFEDEFRPFYEKEFEFLMDLNIGLQEVTLRLLNVFPKISFTSEYKKKHEGLRDLRQVPPALPEEKYNRTSKRPPDITGSYPQVFDDRFEFTPGLSIVDLLFNEGPGATQWLQNAQRNEHTL